MEGYDSVRFRNSNCTIAYTFDKIVDYTGINNPRRKTFSNPGMLFAIYADRNNPITFVLYAFK